MTLMSKLLHLVLEVIKEIRRVVVDPGLELQHFVDGGGVWRETGTGRLSERRRLRLGFGLGHWRDWRRRCNALGSSDLGGRRPRLLAGFDRDGRGRGLLAPLVVLLGVWSADVAFAGLVDGDGVGCGDCDLRLVRLFGKLGFHALVLGLKLLALGLCLLELPGGGNLRVGGGRECGEKPGLAD